MSIVIDIIIIIRYCRVPVATNPQQRSDLPHFAMVYTTKFAAVDRVIDVSPAAGLRVSLADTSASFLP